MEEPLPDVQEEPQLPPRPNYGLKDTTNDEKGKRSINLTCLIGKAYHAV